MKNTKNMVEIPKAKEIVIDKKGYVYYIIEYKYNPKTKHTDDIRKSIGKICESNSDFMYPNKNYLELFHIDILEEPSTIDSYLHYGAYLAIKQVSKTFGVLNSLKRSFPKLYEKIFALALFAIDSEDSTAQHYEKWGFSNYSGLDSCLSSGNISEIYREIGKNREAREEFLKLYHKEYTNNNIIKERNVLAFDSTNQNTSANSENMQKAENGKAKKDECLPIINTAFFTDENTGIPIYYETFYGSILDKTETPFTKDKIESLGFKKCFFIMDRGYYSEKSIKAMKNDDFAIMCPENLEEIKLIFTRYKNDIVLNYNAYIPEENVYGMKINEEFKKGLTHYIYYDPDTAHDEINMINGKIEHMLAELKKPKTYYSKKLAEKYSKYFTLIPEKNRGKSKFKIIKNNKAIQEEIDNAGLFAIISNTKISSKEMIQIARKRDTVEKNFKTLKTHLLFDKPDVHNDLTFDGKMFVMFIALNLLTTYKYLIKNHLDEISSRTIHTSLSSLNKIIIEKRDNVWSLRYALTKKNKEILSLLGLDKNIESKLRKFISPDKII